MDLKVSEIQSKVQRWTPAKPFFDVSTENKTAKQKKKIRQILMVEVCEATPDW